MMILKFLWSGFLANWKVILIALAAIFVYWKASNWIETYIEEQKAEEQTITALTSARDRAVIEALSAQGTMWEMRAQMQRNEINHTKALEEQIATRNVSEEQKDAFEGHDLEEMAVRHGPWMEKIINKGTQERLDEIEAAFNQ